MPRLKKANDRGVPEDEMILAKAVQSAAARGLGVCWGPAYSKNGGMTMTNDYDCCCAHGALLLDSGYGPKSRGMAAGHEGWFRDEAEPGPAYQAGVVFADAMPRGKRHVVWSTKLSV